MTQQRYADIQLVTPQAVSSTVMTDGRTRIWFNGLLGLPEVRRHILEGGGDAESQYRALRALTIFGSVFLTVSAGLTVWILLSSHDLGGVRMAALVCAAGGLYLFLRRRWRIAHLAARLIDLDRSMIPPGVTLYQLGEQYSRKYGISSLVDVISLWGKWSRGSFLFLWLATFGIYFLSFGKTVLWVSAGCLAGSLLIRIFVVRRICRGCGQRRI